MTNGATRQDKPPYWPRGLPLTMHVPHTTLFDNLRISAERYPDKAAVVYGRHVTTWRALFESAERIAGWLQQKCGVGRGDRVLLYGQNSPHFITAYHAILRAEAVVVPVNPMNLTEEVGYFAADSGACVVVGGSELFAQIAPLLGGDIGHALLFTYSEGLGDEAPSAPDWVRAPRPAIDHPSISHWSDALAANCQPEPYEGQSDDLCIIPYTSGTTGRSKGCRHTHRSMITGCVTPTIWRSNTPESVFLGVAPLFHLLGLQGSVNGATNLGSTMVLLPRWDAEAAAALIEKWQVTHWGAAPPMLMDLLSSSALQKYNISSLQVVTGGGAGMPEAVSRRLKEELGITYLEGWGMTETASMAMANPPQRPKLQCLGIPTFGVEARVIDPDTFAELSTGEVGELVVCGDQVMLGYWKNPQADLEAFIEIDGKRYLRTGDLVLRDEDGYYFMVDRLKRMINTGGFKVWPLEVESVLFRHPAIQEACVIASRDERRGEVVKALVVKRANAGDISAKQIIEWSRAQMAAYKCPRIVSFIDALPRSGTGKIDWRRLQDDETQG